MGIYNNQYSTPCNVYPRRLMVIYYGMKQRCYYKKQSYYLYYGDRMRKLFDNLDDAKIFRDLLYKETFYGAAR